MAASLLSLIRSPCTCIRLRARGPAVDGLAAVHVGPIAYLSVAFMHARSECAPRNVTAPGARALAQLVEMAGRNWVVVRHGR